MNQEIDLEKTLNVYKSLKDELKLTGNKEQDRFNLASLGLKIAEGNINPSLLENSELEEFSCFLLLQDSLLEHEK